MLDRVVTLSLAAVAALWGTAGVATQAALRGGVGPAGLTALRMTVASLLLLAYLAVRRRPVHVSRHLLRDGAVLALAQVVLPSVLFAAALQHLPSGAVSLLYALAPAATVVWMRVLLGTGVGRAGAGGLALSAAGAALVLQAAGPAAGDAGAMLGAWLVVVAVTVASFAGVYAKRHATHPSLEVLAPEIVIGTVVLLAPALVAGSVDWTGLSLATWAVVGYLAVGVTIVPAALLLWLMRRTTALRVSLVNYLFPVVAVVLGVLWFGEPLTGQLALGGAVLLTGVGIVEAAVGRGSGHTGLRACPDLGAIPAVSGAADRG
jgi:drug/metabolite transporter (DMT)-like permease